MQITQIMFYFPQPINWSVDPDVSAVFLFLEVEWAVFLGTLGSNVVFIALRTCFHHKIQLDVIPERKQLPGVDTIIAIQEVSNAFGA